MLQHGAGMGCMRPYRRCVGHSSVELCRAAAHRLFAGAQWCADHMTKQVASSACRHWRAICQGSQNIACGQGTGYQPVSTCLRSWQLPFGCDRHLS
jgi:hypothetical protein